MTIDTDSEPFAETDDEGIKEKLIELMPLNHMVIDLWDWDIHFEEITFDDDLILIATGPEDYAIEQAKLLAEDFLRWIDEYDMDYDQENWPEGKFEDWIEEGCIAFIKDWRLRVSKEYKGKCRVPDD